MPTPKTEEGRASGRAYYAANRKKCNESSVRWQLENRDKHLADRRKWYARNAESGRAKCKAWREANREKQAPRLKKWRQSNRHMVSLALNRRRAAMLGAAGRGVDTRDWIAVLDASLGLCAYCNERKPLTMDHIEPLSLGGGHDPDNIVAACQSCNSSKHNSTLIVWLARMAA